MTGVRGQGHRVDLPLIRTGGWRVQAACVEKVNDRLWDDRVDGEKDVHREQRHRRAKAICARCPVRNECLADVDWDVDAGIRGGFLIAETRFN